MSQFEPIVNKSIRGEIENKFSNAKNENMKLQLQLDVCTEVVTKTKAVVTSEGELLDEKLQEIWSDKLAFLEEINLFHEQRGISSPWWNAQALAIDNPDIRNAGSSRRQLQRSLETIRREVDEIRASIASGREQISQQQQRLLAAKDTILELNKMKENLPLEPFLREWQGSHQQGGKYLLETSDITKASNIRLGVGRLPDLQKPHKVFKMKEKTTVVYRRQTTAPSYSMDKFIFENSGRNLWGKNDTENTEQYDEVTHY